ncbi:MAG TPA: FecR family protein [Gammaproteobacteria bacterium]|nr:FecR family protein [Gammaproteobacteria bacterium]
MKRNVQIWIGFLVMGCLAVSTAGAQSKAVVAGVQAPVWLERDGVKQPLQAGASLAPGDRLYTGKNARILLNMPDASTVKLGEHVKFEIRELNAAPADQPFRGFLRVLAGAFRYTTSSAGKSRARELNVQVGTATIGIRGTDVWGRSGPQQDLVCLLEGKIEISREGEPAVPMHEPLSVYTATPKKPADPLSMIDTPTVQALALETELTPGQGVMQGAGRYRVYLYLDRKEAKIRHRLKKLREDGYAAEIYTTSVAGETRYRIVIPYFATIDDAAAAGAQLAKRYRIDKEKVEVGEI